MIYFPSELLIKSLCNLYVNIYPSSVQPYFAELCFNLSTCRKFKYGSNWQKDCKLPVVKFSWNCSDKWSEWPLTTKFAVLGFSALSQVRYSWVKWESKKAKGYQYFLWTTILVLQTFSKNFSYSYIPLRCTTVLSLVKQYLLKWFNELKWLLFLHLVGCFGSTNCVRTYVFRMY